MLWLQAGARYWVVLDGDRVMPDPASRFQPDGVHGPSELIDPRTFPWHDQEWRGRPIDALTIYELHVGTFTPEGTFAAAADRLDALADLGITAVELMPVAAFPGRWNWGYDPAAQFAPASTYGRPDDLRQFVDRAHALGVSVLLDVVYNHFGPDGAYAAACSPLFFSDRHPSPWGAGINLDGPASADVRRFFIENALHWLIEYHIDGLRLDATHALVDEGREHFLAELTRHVRATIPDRDIVLIAEDNRNLREVLEPIAGGGWGFDGLWSDDFHHISRRLVAGDAEGYFRDFAGTTGELTRALRDGWLYRGEHSIHAEGPRGTDPVDLPLPAFVICLQNHDQVGNRPFGDRLSQTIDLATYRALTLLLLLAPETPLLFMGQEWAASSPFHYFTDHAGDLGRQVREGRRAEFRHFQAFTDAASRDLIPDPQDPATFERSRLVWDERAQPPHAGVLALHRQTLRLRTTIVPAGRSPFAPRATADESGPLEDVTAIDESAVIMRRQLRDGGTLFIVARLTGTGAVQVDWAGLKTGPYEDPHDRSGRPHEGSDPNDRSSAPNDRSGRSLDRPILSRVFDTEAPEFAVDPQPISFVVSPGHVNVAFTRPGAVALRTSVGTGQ